MQQTSATPLDEVLAVATRIVKTERLRVKAYCAEIDELCSKVVVLTHKTLYRETPALQGGMRRAESALTRCKSALRREYELLWLLDEQAQQIRFQLRAANFGANVGAIEIRHAFARPARALRLNGPAEQSRAAGLYDFYLETLAALRQLHVRQAQMNVDCALLRLRDMGSGRKPAK